MSDYDDYDNQRDMFAAHALTGLISLGGYEEGKTERNAFMIAYQMMECIDDIDEKRRIAKSKRDEEIRRVQHKEEMSTRIENLAQLHLRADCMTRELGYLWRTSLGSSGDHHLFSGAIIEAAKKAGMSDEQIREGTEQ